MTMQAAPPSCRWTPSSPAFSGGNLSGSARLASSLVKADPRYANIVSNLLGRIVVVDDINEASRVARELGYHNKVVTLDGQVINAGGSFTGGSVQRSAGLFTRKQEMEELRVRAAKLQKGLPRGAGPHRRAENAGGCAGRRADRHRERDHYGGQ